MALTLEDGTGVVDADSYASLAELNAYAASRGITLAGNDAAKEVLLRNAADYLDSLESRFKGDRVDPEQALAWPRSGVYLFESEVEFANDAIPAQLIKAQCQLACDAEAGGTNLLPNGSGREVLRTKVDVIETEYAKTGQGAVLPRFTKALAILEPLFSGGGMSVQTVRV